MRNRGTYGKGAKGKADRLTSLLARSRGRCESCGDTTYEKLQCAHVVPRTFSATRCDLSNVLALCWSCHRRFTDDPFAWVSFVHSYLGEVEYQRLRDKARTGVGVKVDWEAVAADLAEQWGRVEKFRRREVS
jgi:hypothetical protein